LLCVCKASTLKPMRQAGVRSEILRACSIVLAASIPYAITLTGFYLIDDVKMILRGVYPHKYLIFHDPLLIGKGFFRPLVIVLCRIDGFFWSTSAGGYRFSNIILFTAISVLLYFFLRRWTTPLPAWFAALVFALHPINVGTVAWISGRVDLLPAMLLMATALLMIGTSSVAALTAGNMFFAAALFSKEIAITFPIVIWLGEILLAGKDIRSATRRSALPFIMVFAYLAGRFAVDFWPHDQFYSPFQQINTYGWLGNAFIMVTNVIYIPLPFWHPMDVFVSILEPGWERAPELTWAIIYFLSFGIILPLLVLRVVRDRGRKRAMFFGLAWFFITAIPSIHILRSMGGSRYLCLSVVGAALIIAVVVRELGSNFKPVRHYFLAAAFLAICLTSNIIEQKRWREAMDLAEISAYKVEACAEKLPYGSKLIVFDMPHYSPAGRPLYPSFDTYSLHSSYRLIVGRPRVRVVRGVADMRKFCKTSGIYCISWEKLTKGKCPE